MLHRRVALALPGLLALALAAPLAAQPLPTAKPEEVGLDPARLARIRPALEREIEENRLPGAVVMVARRGRLAYAEAIGLRDRTANAAMPMDAVFRIYSMTKPLASVAAMMLVEEGRLQLTDPVGRFLPGFDRLQVAQPVADATLARLTYRLVPQNRQMTVQDLLRHTSGLTYPETTSNQAVRTALMERGFQTTGAPEYDARSLSPQEFVQRLAQAPLMHQPGTTFEYSLSTDVLGRVVEAVSGQRLEVFLEERLFRPLRMTDTGFALKDGQGGRLAQSLGVDWARGNAPVPMLDVSRPPGNASGGAGAIASAGDYLRFLQMLANGGQLDGQRILAPATVRLMTADHLAGLAVPEPPGALGTPGYGFGLGFAVRLQDGVAGVPGNAGQYMWAGYGGTYFWVDPKADLVAVFMSQAPSVQRPMHRRLFQTLVYSAVID
ncbi:serine hydrolase domain-containing protein [Paracraurococcus ruber]|uniref:Serine hydrolase n=1 Tax=Paracraurococcus ruber TaxID=77675 RepID=A0ABS1CWR6_9PROT|nr:serine hydrolase domain-containing protein [Paracraurococcus ruber]MBK1658964.1 serine hydrolase [Paracraurococcus ruber]TDG28822.1 class A beta-lactamase-related serine hydrolase [Paracraurococcus ruber]